MSLKVLLFGHTEGVVSLIEQLKQPSASNHAVTDETIVVDTVVYDDTPFIVFSIKDRSLVAEQATGSNGKSYRI